MIGVLRRFIVGVAVVAIAGCGTNQPPKWTLWYIPNEPRTGVTLAKLCHTFIFASAADPKTFRVAVVKQITGGKVGEEQAYVQAGDAFTGPLELGPGTIHDDSTGYDLNVAVVYKIDAYVAAKARADADCPPPVKHVPVVRPSPKPSSPAPSHT
jgi:hypothetical protein